MPFNFGEFLVFVKYFLPQFYVIAAAVILLAWLLSQIKISETSKGCLSTALWTLFVATIVANLSIATLIFLQKTEQIYLPIASAVLTHNLYVISIAMFYFFGVSWLCFAFNFRQVRYIVLVYLAAFPIVFVLNLYDFFQLSQIALGQ